MGALPSSSSEVAKWVPEDDILLKNAIEAGASLEALAKGAVNFTRRFSLKELQERWRALLYDSEMSAEASARMIEHESNTSKPNPNPSTNPFKRTADSVRSRYYSMRKRVCTNQPVETAAPNEMPMYGFGSDNILPFLSDQSGVGPSLDPPPDYTESLIMSPQICPHIEEREDLEMAESDGDGKSGIEPVTHDPDPFWRSIQREEQQEAMSQAKEARSSSEIMNELMNFPMEFENDVFNFMDERDIAVESCSVFLDFPQDEVVNQADGSEADLPNTDSACADGNNNAVHEVCNSVATELVPLEEKFMVCVLNTEDWDIPDNDHLNFDDVMRDPNDGVNKHNSDMGACSAMPLTDGLIGVKPMEPLAPVPVPVTVPSLIPVPASLEPLRTTESSILRQNVGLVPMVRTSSSSLEYGSTQVPVSGVMRQNSSDSNELNPSLNEGPVPQDMGNHGISEKPKETKPGEPVQAVLEAPVLAASQMDYYPNQIIVPMGCSSEKGGQFNVPEKDDLATQAAMTVGAGAEEISGMGPGPGPDLLPVASASDHEEQQASEESENEVPSFSDIEAMILDMDLSPFDQESHVAKEVTRFHCAESRKSLIWLEQGARSYMNRAILSRGAFAVLYGRNLKYFIKSPEVSIGRETEDVKVDIDLGKEGRANKISRRQAIIKMDESGLFQIRNIGKCSLFVNSKEVPAKKRINLTSGSLIEIRDLRFIFEINEKAVSRYIFTMCHTGESHRANFEWASTLKP